VTVLGSNRRDVADEEVAAVDCRTRLRARD
jgi:hypothetical protein